MMNMDTRMGVGSRRRVAFTLIELMVVISIIALLASLTVWLIPVVTFNAKKLVTLQRIDAISAGMSQIGTTEGSATYVLQHQVICQDPYAPHPPQLPQAGWPHYEGVVTFDTSGFYTAGGTNITNPDPFPLVNAAAVPPLNEGQWFTAVPPPSPYQTGTPTNDYDDHLFNFPWGKSPMVLVTNSNPPLLGTIIPPEHHVLRNLCPYQTINLLHFANILTDDPYTDTSGVGKYVAGDQFVDISGAGTYQYASDLYTTDRKGREPWNDKWGNPIVVAYGLFQVQPFPSGLQTYPGIGGPQGPNPFATQALQVYQYSRSFTYAIAAAGPIVRNITPAKLASSTMSDWIDSPPGASPGAIVTPWQPSPVWNNANYTTSQNGGNLYLIWKQANQICQQPQGADPIGQPELRSWNENSVVDPPWVGTKWGHRNVNGRIENCFLSAPQEIR